MTDVQEKELIPPNDADKILFASDHPVLAMSRAVTEARALQLREGVLEKFLYDNAQRLLFEREGGDDRGEALRTGMEGY